MQKRFSGGAKEWLLLLAAAALMLAFLVLPLRFALAERLNAEEQQLAEAFRKGELIRIHILANSDSPTDQTLKLKVRDAIIEAFGNLLREAGTQNSEAVFSILQQNADRMLESAKRCCVQNGFPPEAAVETGILKLPSRRYGKVVLPEGEYRALRIRLGEGRGQNWWCVLYPQLCLALSGDEQPETSGLRWCSGRIFAHWLLLET